MFYLKFSILVFAGCNVFQMCCNEFLRKAMMMDSEKRAGKNTFPGYHVLMFHTQSNPHPNTALKI